MRPGISKIWTKFPRASSGQVSAIAAVAAVGVSLPSAIITLNESGNAREQAKHAQELLNQSERMLEVAEEKLANSERSLAQMERYLDLAAKSADLAKLEADAAKRSAGAAVNTAATQQARLNLEMERASAEARPYVTYAGAEFDRVALGKKIKVVNLFSLSGQSKPRKVNVWSNFRFYKDSFNTPRAPACGKGSSWSFLGQFLPNGRVTSRRSKLPTEQEVRDYNNGSKSLMIYGVACYEGTAGRTHRTEFCAYKISNSSTTWTACKGIADPT